MIADFGERCGFRFSGSILATSVLAVHGERRISFDQAKGAPLYKDVFQTANLHLSFSLSCLPA